MRPKKFEISPLLLVPAAFCGFLAGRKLAGKKLLPSSEPIMVSDGEAAARPTTSGKEILASIKPEPWAEFVSRMETAPRTKVSARYKLGAFQMDARRLADVGVMTDVRKAKYGSEMGVWTGKWAHGLSEKDFLGSMPLQYAAFVRGVRATAPQVSRHVGRVIDGKKASLSGLLGVAHVAGIAGVESWVQDPAVRSRFGTTTGTFHRCNGIF